MGTGIACQEALEADEVGMDGRADQDGATAARLDQAGPAQEQRAHDPLADLRFGNQHGSETVAGDEKHLGVAVGPGIREARLAREHACLRQKAAGPQLDDVQDVAETVPGAQADRPRDEDEHRGVDIPRPEQQLAGGVAAGRSEPPEPVDLLGAQAREHLFQPEVRGGHQVLPILSRRCDSFSRRAMRRVARRRAGAFGSVGTVAARPRRRRTWYPRRVRERHRATVHRGARGIEPTARGPPGS